MELERVNSLGVQVFENLRSVSPFGKYATDPGENYFEFRAPETRLICHTIGLGDVMMVKQLGRAFVTYLGEYGDPELGDIVLTSGGYAPNLHQVDGDVNLYWWYSFGPLDDRPGQFLTDQVESNIDHPPDVVLCASDRFRREAEQCGYDTLHFPIGTYGYEPLELNREGMGYAGSKWHKSGEKIKEILGPFRDRADFDWVSKFRLPDELNLWYNTRLVTFGVTRGSQREWGTVNSRVFETLASGTPLVLRDHPTVEDILGFDYPYQVDSRTEAIDLVDTITSDPDDALADFSEFSQKVRNRHDYVTRLKTLFDYLD